MSTNYYAYGPFRGGEPGSGLHVGQAAAGWRFLFRAHPDLGLTTYEVWRAFLRQPGVRIENEYGREVGPDEMERTMTQTERSDGTPLLPRVSAARRQLPDGWHLDADYHAFCAKEFC